MKRLLLIVFPLLLILGCSETVKSETVTEVIEYHSSIDRFRFLDKTWRPKKIRVYDIIEDKMDFFTYKEIEFYADGQKKSECVYQIREIGSLKEIRNEVEKTTLSHGKSYLISEKKWNEDGSVIE